MGSRLLLVVEETFAIAGRDVIVAPDVKLDDSSPRAMSVELRRPDGTTVSAEALVEIPFIDPPRLPLTIRHVLRLTNLTKQDIPIGTQIWATELSEAGRPPGDHRQVSERADRVWNRAAVESGGPTPREGDKALAALLEAHGYVMNGGVFHAIKCLGPDRLQLSCDGYVYFGLHEIASVLGAAAKAEQTDKTEDDFNRAYWSYAKDDAVIVECFKSDFTAHPDRYAP